MKTNFNKGQEEPMRKINSKLVEEVRKALEEHSHPNPTKYCLNSRPQNKGMLGGPKYLCMMPKDHEGKCFQIQQWSPHC